MKTTNPVDAARIELLLSDLRLPAIKLMWAKFAEQSDKEGWPAARFLAALAEHEVADRGRRRIERHLVEARLPVGKTLASFDFEAVPMVSKAQVMALTAGDGWLEKGANLLLFGRPAPAKATWPPPSGSRSLRTDGACCSCAPAISCNVCRSHVVNSPLKAPSPSSTSIIS
jgi:IstB-like ATP binding protein